MKGVEQVPIKLLFIAYQLNILKSPRMLLRHLYSQHICLINHAYDGKRTIADANLDVIYFYGHSEGYTRKQRL